jgi:hypothetical protein
MVTVVAGGVVTDRSASAVTRIAYVVVFFVALFAGNLLVDLSVLIRTIVGVLIVLPALLIDLYLSSRRTTPRAGGR